MKRRFFMDCPGGSEGLDRGADPLIGSARTKILKFRANFGAVMAGFHGSDAGHQHPGLAVTALRYLLGKPGRLRLLTLWIG